MASNTVEALSELVAAHMGEPCRSVELLAPGHSLGRTFGVELAGGRRVVAKLSAAGGSLEPAVGNLRTLRELGLPVPEVLAFDSSRSKLAVDVLIMSHLRGRDLGQELPAMTRPQLSRLAEQVIDIQRTVGTLPTGDGCGFAAIGERPTRTWSDVVCRPNAWRFADPPPGDVAGLLPRLRRLIERAEPYFAAVKPICFLDDLTTKNVLVEDGELTGVVDFDVVCYGDPLFHLGLTAAALTSNGAPLGGFYADELFRRAGLDGTARPVVDLYQAVFLINFLGAEDPYGQGPWRSRCASAAAALLTSCEVAAAGW